ncbi:uncharacterized protein LOC131683732 [Topomyia yanbarensis]|uniref:uncharacterized protein LOC131683732 n=1 Tax=Topomyia yanbarensis TaxID=2498891 RepID=UPI00273B35F9|nr:uncharacterized protein LOC131683732 [Topomyia yanbarensis]
MASIELENVSPMFNEAMLNDIIRDYGGHNFTSWHFEDSDFGKGDSYLSEVYRLRVVDDTTRKADGDKPLEVKLVVKTIPKNVGRRLTFRSADFFRNEINFYNIVMSEFNKFQQEKRPANPFIESSKCLAAYTDGVNDFVAMEDLNQFGYGSASRLKGVNLPECILCMQTLGRFHALSLAMKDQQPDKFHFLVKNVEDTYYARVHKTWYENFQKVQISIAKDAVGQVYGGTELEQKVHKFFNCDFYDKMVYWTHTRNQNSVINHGDCWMPNFLFRYDDNGAPTSTKMLDYQLARYSSPALDISFFVYSCTSQALREAHYEDLLNAYHQSLSDMLRDLGSNPEELFPYSDLQKELHEFARFGVGMGIESIPFSLLEEHEVADLDQIQGDTAVPIENVWSLKNIKTEEGRRRLADMFKHAESCGYLD